jgi:hypothetical protein
VPGRADLAGDGGQRNQATHVVGAMGVLAHAHAPQNHGGLCRGVGTGHFADDGCGNAADRSHRLRAERGHTGADGGQVVHVLGHIGLVHQAFFKHGVQQCVQQHHVGVGLEREGAPRVLGQVSAARVGHDDAGAALRGVFHPGGGHGVVGRGVGSDDDDEV